MFPFFLRIPSSDTKVFQQIFESGDYDFNLTRIPNVIVDAGANIGLASIYLANKFPYSKIIAIEPEENNYEILKQNVEQYANIIPVRAALWHIDTILNVVDIGRGEWSYMTQTRGEINKDCSDFLHETRAITVNTLMNQHAIDHIDIFKIDIEGAEREVFSDTSSWIEKVDILIVELHERMKPGCNRSFYNGTNGFDNEWSRGENVYLARSGACLTRGGSAASPEARKPEESPIMEDNKVDVIVNVFGKPWQTLCTLKSLLKHSGDKIDKIFLIKEKQQPYNENIDWIYKYFDNLIIFTPDKYKFLHNRINYYSKKARYRVRYQYGIENSDKTFVFISHNDVLYTGDIVGDMLREIGGSAGIGQIGQCWNCPAQPQGVCRGELFYEWNPSYDDVINLGLPYRRTRLSDIDKKNPKPLPECRLNEWACLINRDIVMRECYPNGNSPLIGQKGTDLGTPWFRNFHLKGYKFAHYEKNNIHSYWASTSGGYRAQLDKKLYDSAEENAKGYFFENFALPEDNSPTAAHPPVKTSESKFMPGRQAERTRRFNKLRDIAQLIQLTMHKPVIEFNAGVGPVLVFGSARSGTTWIGDVISTMTKARQIFEPFVFHTGGYFLFTAHRDLTKTNCDLNYQLYIGPNSPSCLYKDQIADILFKPHRNSWCDQMCRHGIYRKRLIKDVRANLFMAYIAHNWPSLKILWIVRNPVDVIESQVAMAKEGYTFDWNLGQIKSQPDLVRDWLSPFVSEMEAAKSFVERLCHKWCIENFIPFKQRVEERPNVHLVRYDRLVAGLEQWDPLMKFLGQGGNDAGILRSQTAKPSRVSRKVVLGHGAKAQREHLSGEDIDYIARTVRLYGLDRLIEPDGVETVWRK